MRKKKIIFHGQNYGQNYKVPFPKTKYERQKSILDLLDLSYCCRLKPCSLQSKVIMYLTSLLANCLDKTFCGAKRKKFVRFESKK